ncbi:hypothetical protein MJI46_32870, partial [Salmonella enterica subsp. enterica serovar Cerro]|nr:hypothetical protein [Salmonella enterica subsp. enterica serovar Cerro]
YFRLAPRHNRIVNHLIYPIPDPAMPFLGVHLTRMIDGSVTVGQTSHIKAPHPSGVTEKGISEGESSLSDNVKERCAFCASGSTMG